MMRVCHVIQLFSFLFYYACAKSLEFFITAVSLSYDIRSAF